MAEAEAEDLPASPVLQQSEAPVPDHNLRQDRMRTQARSAKPKTKRGQVSYLFPLETAYLCGNGYQLFVPKPNHSFRHKLFQVTHVACASAATSTTRIWSSDTGPDPDDTVTTV